MSCCRYSWRSVRITALPRYGMFNPSAPIQTTATATRPLFKPPFMPPSPETRSISPRELIRFHPASVWYQTWPSRRSGAVLQMADGGTGAILYGTNVSNVNIDTLQSDGNKNGAPNSQYAVYLCSNNPSGIANCAVQNCSVKNCNQDGIFLYGSTSTTRSALPSAGATFPVPITLESMPMVGRESRYQQRRHGKRPLERNWRWQWNPVQHCWERLPRQRLGKHQ